MLLKVRFFHVSFVHNKDIKSSENSHVNFIYFFCTSCIKGKAGCDEILIDLFFPVWSKAYQFSGLNFVGAVTLDFIIFCFVFLQDNR